MKGRFDPIIPWNAYHHHHHHHHYRKHVVDKPFPRARAISIPLADARLRLKGWKFIIIIIISNDAQIIVTLS